MPYQIGDIHGRNYSSSIWFPSCRPLLGFPKWDPKAMIPYLLSQMPSVYVRDRVSGDITLPYKATVVTHGHIWWILGLSLTGSFWFPMQADTKCYPEEKNEHYWLYKPQINTILSKQYDAVVLSSVAISCLNIYRMLMFWFCELQYSHLFSEERYLNCSPYPLPRFSGSVVLTSLYSFQTELT